MAIQVVACLRSGDSVNGDWAVIVNQLRVLVTGGAGFLGSHLCDELHKRGHEVWCLDNLRTGFRKNIQHLAGSSRFHLVVGDVREPLEELSVDKIYNMACPASPRHYQADPIGTMQTSVLGAMHVLDLARRTGARVLQASTSEIYGDPEVHPQPETYSGAVNPIGPRACYDEGKRAAETLFFDYHREHGVTIRVARLFNSYGPRMSAGDGRVIPNFIDQALRNEPITLYGDGSQTRSFCYVTDTIEGLLGLMEAPGDAVGPVNLGNPDEFTIAELAELVVAKTGSTSIITRLPLPQDDPKLRRPDIERAKSLLGWTPRVTLGEGLDRVIAAARLESDRFSPPAAIARGARRTVAIIGGGPAGLTAAYVALTRGDDLHPVVIEADRLVGGIARTESYKGYRFDIGGHRFFTKVKPVRDVWHEVMQEEFLRRPRMSRIYYKDKYYAYPLKIFNALGNIGAYESTRILLSYMKWRSRPHVEEENFEQWVTNRFGGRLFWHFFKTYTEKVWGMPCTEIKADWAAQRIKNLSLRKAVMNAFTGANDTSSLIEEFDYPRLGPGMMWETMTDQIRALGGEVRLQATVTKVLHESGRITAVCTDAHGEGGQVTADHFISSMPITELVRAMDPPPPERILAAASRLRYRDFLIVTLILDHPDPFPDNWIYIHSPEVKVGRIQNFRSWSPDMVPDADRSSIGMEYFCNQGDDIWTMSTQDLIAMASRELEHLGLAKASSVVDGTVIRQPLAYPVYDGDYREALDLLRGWLAQFGNLQMVGRNGMHRYNNQDHSMLTAMYAIENIRGADHDLWSVNVDQSYHEDVESAPRFRKARRKSEAAV